MAHINTLLEISTVEIDGGGQIGRRPDKVRLEILRENFSTQNPLKAIRAKCIDCSGGDMAEVRKCVTTSCPLWPFRMGANPFPVSQDKGSRQMKIRPPQHPFNTTPLDQAGRVRELRRDNRAARRLKTRLGTSEPLAKILVRLAGLGSMEDR